MITSILKGNICKTHILHFIKATLNMNKAIPSNNLVWVDLEMSGLDVEKERILEFACIVTDQNLNILAEGPNIIIKELDEVLDNMNDWCKEHHGKSGLTAAVRNSKINLHQAEDMALNFIKQHTPAGKCPLAGNSVHADKEFLVRYMPLFMEHLHYRIVDVSTVKELCRRWYVSEFQNAPKKQGSHRALDDLRESIAELRYYRETVFKKT